MQILLSLRNIYARVQTVCCLENLHFHMGLSILYCTLRQKFARHMALHNDIDSLKVLLPT